MSPFQNALLLILFPICCMHSEVIFKETDSNQQYYPRFALELTDTSCGLTVCKTCIQIRCNNGVIHDSNQQYGNEYAWDYGGTTFAAPLTFVITKSNGEKQWFNNLISSYGNDPNKAYPTSRIFCPTQSPTKSPQPSPTTSPLTPLPTNNPTQKPIENPSISPTKNPTTNPSISPTNNPSIPPTQNPSQFPSKTPTRIPSTLPSQYPTQSPSYKPTKQPSLMPSIAPTRNDAGGGVIETIATTNVNTNAPLHNNNDATSNMFSDSNQTLIVILGAIVGTLALCIVILLICYFGKRKKNEDIEKGMQLGRVMSNSIVVKGESEIVNNESETVEINAMLTAPDSPGKNENNNNNNNQVMIAMTPLSPQIQPINAFGIGAVNNSKNNNGNVNDDMYGGGVALKMWLNACGVPQYYNIFVEEGFDEQLSTVAALNDNDLQRMGIVNASHRTDILNQIEIMKTTQQSPRVSAQQHYEGDMLNTNELPTEQYESENENENCITPGNPSQQYIQEKQSDNSNSSDDDNSNDIYKKKNDNNQTVGN